MCASANYNRYVGEISSFFYYKHTNAYNNYVHSIATVTTFLKITKQTQKVLYTTIAGQFFCLKQKLKFFITKISGLQRNVNDTIDEWI